MKVFARFLLLSFWLYAIVAPSIITLLDTENPIIVTLNEEEQHETVKKSSVEEKYVNESYFDFSLITFSNQLNLSDYFAKKYVAFTLEILLPPPERIV